MSKKQDRSNNLPQGRDGKFFRICRRGIFYVILVIEVLIFFTNFLNTVFGRIPAWIPLLIVEGVFTISCFLTTFVLKKYNQKIACYVVEFVSQFLLTLLTNSSYLSIIYVLILSEYYISAPKLSDGVAMVICSLVIYLLTYSISAYILASEDIMVIVTSCFSEMLLIVIHFAIVEFSLNLYDTKQKLTESLAELDESNQKLQRAYDDLAEVTILQERQRIARDIHDTAGHAITTVIMQTEAAKLIVETDPQEAKRRIVAANLQAKSALEELRRSVHLLAGDRSTSCLKDDLEHIIHDSCDGTDIVIRYEIEDVDCSSAKRRFLTNGLKECISNGLRHGHATAFYFELSRSNGEILFLLSDNGSGADIHQLKEGFGMKSLRSRTESFGGNVEFSSDPEEGFEVRIKLPEDNRAGMPDKGGKI